MVGKFSLLLTMGMLTAACFAIAADDEPAKATVPKDFAVHARYSPGLAPYSGWEISINATGKTVLTIYQRAEPKVFAKKGELKPEQVQQLFDEVATQKYTELKGRYIGRGTDAYIVDLAITSGGKTHKVSVDNVREQKNADVARFIKVWDLIEKLVPPPRSAS